MFYSFYTKDAGRKLREPLETVIFFSLRWLGRTVCIEMKTVGRQQRSDGYTSRENAAEKGRLDGIEEDYKGPNDPVRD